MVGEALAYELLIFNQNLVYKICVAKVQNEATCLNLRALVK